MGGRRSRKHETKSISASSTHFLLIFISISNPPLSSKRRSHLFTQITEQNGSWNFTAVLKCKDPTFKHKILRGRNPAGKTRSFCKKKRPATSNDLAPEPPSSTGKRKDPILAEEITNHATSGGEERGEAEREEGGRVVDRKKKRPLMRGGPSERRWFRETNAVVGFGILISKRRSESKTNKYRNKRKRNVGPGGCVRSRARVCRWGKSRCVGQVLLP